MIQFKRGKTSNWNSCKTPLADGQPGYDKERHKIKIGNGEDSWSNLPDASGLRREEILSSEEDAKKNIISKALNPLGTFLAKLLKLDDRPVFTYGTEAPDESTLGQVYLQHYEAEPETDYVVETATNKGWHYIKWHSGWAQCSGTFEFEAATNSPFEKTSLYCSSTLISKDYPLTFTEIPNEVASLKSNGNILWLASKNINSNTKSGSYVLISPDFKDKANYKISFEVSGRWR